MESISLVFALKAKYGLSRPCVNALLQLLKLHVPIQAFYPETEAQAEAVVRRKSKNRTAYFYCPDCMEVLPETKECAICQKNYVLDTEMHNNHMFTIFDIRSQLTSLLGIEEIASAVQKSLFQRRNGPNNIRKHFASLPLNAHDLTLSFNTDGVPLFHSSKTSIWPVLLAINEMPMYLKNRYVLMAGLWVGKGKIVPDLVFPYIVKQLNSLQDTPVRWKLRQEDIISRVYVISVAVDSPARCLVQGHTQFNGEFGCNWCEQQGVVVAKGRGHARVYPLEQCASRSGLEYKNQVMSRNFTKGIQTASPLLLLRNFDVVKGLSVDYMHCVLLGVTRTFFSGIWMKCYAEPYYLGKLIDAVEDRWLSIRVPDEIRRLPRSLRERKYWKATEYKLWLFASPIVLKGLLPEAQLTHFTKLSVAVHKLLAMSITGPELQHASQLLQEFVKGVEDLYGQEFCTFNVHQLTHIVNSVEDLGFLWETSAFIFENANGILKNFVKSGNGVAEQVCKKFFSSLTLARDYEFCKKDHVKLYIQRHLLAETKKDKTSVIHPPFVPISTDDEHGAQTLKYCHIKNIYKSNRATVSRRTIKCNARSKKRVNNLVLQSEKTVGRVISFLKCSCVCDGDCECHTEFAVVELITVCPLVDCPYVFYAASSGTTQVVMKLQELGNEKLCVAELDGKESFLKMPNLIEYE